MRHFIREDFLQSFYSFLDTLTKDEILVYWNAKLQTPATLNAPLLREEMRKFKKEYKKGRLTLNPHNNITRTIKGQEYYIAVVQQLGTDGDIDNSGFNDVCPMGFALNETGMWVVNGCIYAFRHEANRDAFFTYITGNKK